MNPREIISILVVVVLTVMNSCEYTATERYGFDLPVCTGNGGENSIGVDFTVIALRLTGHISASEGKIRAEVISPAGAVEFSITAAAPGDVRFEHIIPAEPGVWQLRYSSLTGTGYVRMHITLER